MRITNILSLELVILLIASLKTNPDTLIKIHPKASSGKHENYIKVFCITLRNQQGDKIKIKITKMPGDATRFTRKYLKKNFEKIIVIGGDGTINEVVNGFFQPLPKYITNSEESYDLIPVSSEQYSISYQGHSDILAKSLNIPIDPMLVCNNIKELKQKRWM